jgi:octaprenyl-diphosphate synthase
MDAPDLHVLTEGEMQLVNRRIATALQSDVALINQMGTYIIGAGGKRLRPKLVLSAASALGYTGSQHINVAAIIEFIHTATLLHDDVVDSSEMRRGKDTANAVWGNEAAVLVGDFLYSRAFEMMVEVGEMRVMEILSSATNTIAAGEVMQLLNIGEPDVDEARYMQVIEAKTAKLFEAAAQLGAVLAGANAEIERATASYGANLGIAFQLVDDVLDYTADSAELGKNAGDDLAEGKPTLPIIYALRDGDADTRSLIRDVLTAPDEEVSADTLAQIIAVVRDSGAIENTYALAAKHVQMAVQAIEPLPSTPQKQAMIDVVESSVGRRF